MNKILNSICFTMKHVKTLVKQMILDNISISVAICLISTLQLCNSWPLFATLAANKSLLTSKSSSGVFRALP